MRRIDFPPPPSFMRKLGKLVSGAYLTLSLGCVLPHFSDSETQNRLFQIKKMKDKFNISRRTLSFMDHQPNPKDEKFYLVVLSPNNF